MLSHTPPYFSESSENNKNSEFSEKLSKTEITTMTKAEFITLFNKTRKANKNNWIVLIEEVEGSIIKTKSYNTWVQRMEYKGFITGGPMDCSVKQVNEFLVNTI